MRLLILGGTEFVGRAVVESALARGWEVTVFHRGRHEAPAGAATLLGASWWQRFRTIVLPKMKTIIIIALAIRVIENFKIFDTLFIMTGGGPGVATETISVYIYKITQQDLIWGYVAAIALVILIVLSILVSLAISRMNAAKKEAMA